MTQVEDDQAPNGLVKRPTGIPSIDIATCGGLPAHRATLVLGQPGCGKTILGLQVLACALDRGEGGVFVSFEESRKQILRDVAAFSWADRFGETSRCEIIDAQSMKGAELSGPFDIDGLLAVLAMCADRVDGSLIVLDGIDQLLRRQPDPLIAVEQVRQINDWCDQRSCTLLLTGKQAQGGSQFASPDHLPGIEFLLSTIFTLSTELVDRSLHRRFRIAKYRGSKHNGDELAMVIDQDGICLPYINSPSDKVGGSATSERISTGIERLDDVLGGGIYRGSTTLISGQPGTSKTTLAAAFGVAACQRGERVLYVSFDEHGSNIVRNLTSVGLDLQPHIDGGLLALHARKSWDVVAEEHFMALQQMIESFKPDCLVIDPASSLLKSSTSHSPYVALERLLENTTRQGITALLTSIASDDDPSDEATMAQVSTLADTWMVVRFRVHGGERNRSLSVVKSRGTAHSNQVRELVISSEGLALADVYEFGTEVLMGTARVEKESEEKIALKLRERERERRRQTLDQEIEKTRNQITQQQNDLARLVDELKYESVYDDILEQEVSHYQDRIRWRREPNGQATAHDREKDHQGGDT
ncbi:ATPase domain-containing protein [Halomonas aquatica]|uniref:ATPase domain-containing protein n=1 Tax=Halomonas aquatica TaxID=3151123 RepID=A0ABV1NJL3_9GAMM